MRHRWEHAKRCHATWTDTEQLTMKRPPGLIIVPTGLRTKNDPRLGAVGTVANLESDLNGISVEDFEVRCTLRKFQVMAENCRKISRYARQEFHLMTESSA